MHGSICNSCKKKCENENKVKDLITEEGEVELEAKITECSNYKK
jgi:hypothetical protein